MRGIRIEILAVALWVAAVFLGLSVSQGLAFPEQGGSLEFRRAKALFDAGRYDLAEAKLNEILERSPGNREIEINNLLAFVYYKQDRLDPAYQQLKVTIALIEEEAGKSDLELKGQPTVDSRYLSTYFAAAEVMVNTKRFLEAVQLLGRFHETEQFQKSAFLHYLMGIGLLETGQFDGAVDRFRGQERLESDPITDYLIACARTRQGRIKEARTALSRAFTRSPALRAQAQADSACFRNLGHDFPG